MSQNEAIAKQAAAQVWNCAPKQVITQDQTASLYPWAQKHSFILAQGPNVVRMLITVDQNGAATVFNDPKNVKAVNQIFQTEGIKLPDGITAKQLALTVRTLLLGPGGFIGSEEFYAREKSALYMWTSPSPQDGPALFQKYCQDPVVQHQDRGWTLVFYYFNNKGGVEEWKVTGDAQAIKDAKWEPVAPDKTFMFPYG